VPVAVVGLCALVGRVAGFSAVGPLLRTRAPARTIRGGLGAASMVAGVSKVPLDPTVLMQDKALQTCALRPYTMKEENGGLSTATFALG